LANLVIRDLVNYGAPVNTGGKTTSTPPATNHVTTGGLMQKAGEVADFSATGWTTQATHSFDAATGYAAVDNMNSAKFAYDSTMPSFSALTAAHADGGHGASLTIDQATPADAQPAVQTSGADDAQAVAPADFESFDAATAAPQADRVNLTGIDFAPEAARIDALFADPTALQFNFRSTALSATNFSPIAAPLTANTSRSSSVRLVPAAVAACFLAIETSASKRCTCKSTDTRYRPTMA
jgi:hypothetical protein